MAYSYGPNAIPLTASGPPAGRDDFTFYVLQFLQTVANTYTAAEWLNVAPAVAPAAPPLPVRASFDYDPREYIYNEAQTPALHFFRTKTRDHAHIAADIYIERGDVTLLWIPSDATPETRKKRSNFAWKLFQTFDMLLEIGRDPSWVVAGDTYFEPLLYGSTLAHWAKFRRLRIGGCNRIGLKIPGIDSSTFRLVEAYETTCPYELELKIDASARFGELNGLDITLEAPAAPPDLPDPLVLQTISLDD